MENKDGVNSEEQNAGQVKGVGSDELGSIPGISDTSTAVHEQAADDAGHPASSSSDASESDHGKVTVSSRDNAESCNASLSFPFEGMHVTAARQPLRGNFVFPDSEGGELLRITPDAFIFKGEEISDAGKAYDAFDHVMKVTMARISYGAGGGFTGEAGVGSGGNAADIHGGAGGDRWAGHGGGGTGHNKPVLDPAPRGDFNYVLPEGVTQGRGSFGGKMKIIEEDGRNPVSRPASSEDLQKAVAAEMQNGLVTGTDERESYGKLDVPGHYTTQRTFAGEIPLGEPQECVLGMAPIRIRLHRDEWVQSMDTEKEIKPTPEAVFDYLNRTMAMPYTREQFKDITFAHNIGGKYGTGHVVLINGNVIAHTSGQVLDTRKLDPKD